MPDPVNNIQSSRNKSSNTVWHHATVNRERREGNRNIPHKSLLVWFTGLSGSGKSTIAHAVEEQLFQLGAKTYVLDGDNVRHGLNADLGFSDGDRNENIRRIGEMVKLFVDAGIITLAAFISPFQLEREQVKKRFSDGDFMEVYCECALEVCEQRDVKGIYQKAREGIIRDFTGISSPYEKPLSPDLSLNTDIMSLEESVDAVVEAILERVEFVHGSR